MVKSGKSLGLKPQLRALRLLSFLNSPGNGLNIYVSPVSSLLIVIKLCVLDFIFSSNLLFYHVMGFLSSD